jgi:hypothetical protein
MVLRYLLYFTLIAPLGFARDIVIDVESRIVGGERLNTNFLRNLRNDFRYHFINAPGYWFVDHQRGGS